MQGTRRRRGIGGGGRGCGREKGEEKKSREVGIWRFNPVGRK